MRMLSSHSAIYSRAEPHLLTPLAHLGFYDTVDAAPFDHLQAQQSTREFVAELPRGEADYLDACRAYTDVLYGRMLAGARQGEAVVSRQDAGQRAGPAVHRQALPARALRRAHAPSGRDLELVRQLVLRRRLRRGAQVQSDPQPLRAGDGALHPRRAGAVRARRLRGRWCSTPKPRCGACSSSSAAVRGGGDRLREARARVEGARRPARRDSSTRGR